MLSVSQHLIQIRVGDQISQHGLAHGLNISVGVASFHVLIASERSVFISKDTPEGKASNHNSLHFFGDVVGRELYPFDLGWKLDIAVCETNKALKTHSWFNHLAFPYHEEPLIRFGRDKSVLDEESYGDGWDDDNDEKD